MKSREVKWLRRRQGIKYETDEKGNTWTIQFPKLSKAQFRESEINRKKNKAMWYRTIKTLKWEFLTVPDLLPK